MIKKAHQIIKALRLTELVMKQRFNLGHTAIISLVTENMTSKIVIAVGANVFTVTVIVALSLKVFAAPLITFPDASNWLGRRLEILKSASRAAIKGLPLGCGAIQGLLFLRAEVNFR